MQVAEAHKAALSCLLTPNTSLLKTCRLEVGTDGVLSKSAANRPAIRLRFEFQSVFDREEGRKQGRQAGGGH